MFYTPCPYTVWRMPSCQHRMMYSLLILVVHDTIWHWWHSVMMLGNQAYSFSHDVPCDCCLVGKVSWDTLHIHVRRHLFGLCCLGLQQSTNSVKQNSHPYEGFFWSFLVAVGFLCLFQRIEASQAVLWNHYLFLLWTKHGFLAPWPEALHLILPTNH